MKVAVDVYVPAHNLRGIIILAAAFAAVIALSALAVRWRQLLMVRMGNTVIEGLRRQLFSHVNHLAFRFFDERPAGKIIHRIMVYVDRLQQMVKNGIVAIVADVLRIFIIIVFMFAISPSLALVALSVTPFLVAFVFLVKGRIHRLWDDYQYKSANLNAYAHESFIGIKVTQAFVRERRNSRTWAEQLGQNYSQLDVRRDGGKHPVPCRDGFQHGLDRPHLLVRVPLPRPGRGEPGLAHCLHQLRVDAHGPDRGPEQLLQRRAGGTCRGGPGLRLPGHAGGNHRPAGCIPASPVQGARGVPGRALRLRSPGARAPRHQLPGGARYNGGAGGQDRRRQEHDHQPALPLLRDHGRAGS